MIVFGLPLRRASERKKNRLRTPLLGGARSEWVPHRPLLGERHFAMQMGRSRGQFYGGPIFILKGKHFWYTGPAYRLKLKYKNEYETIGPYIY